MSYANIEISRYDLTRSEADILSRHSRGMMDIRQFAKRRPRNNIFDGNYAGNALGITELAKDDLAPYSIACRAFNLRDCYSFSSAYTIESESETGVPYVIAEMEALSRAKIPMVFFVPQKLRTFVDPQRPDRKPYYTMQEMEWAIGNPRKIGNMILVFGLYEHMAAIETELPGTLEACGQYLINSLA